MLYFLLSGGTDEVRCILWVDKNYKGKTFEISLNGVVMKGISVCGRLFIELPAVQQKSDKKCLRFSKALQSVAYLSFFTACAAKC